jgi:hypothetical protein
MNYRTASHPELVLGRTRSIDLSANTITAWPPDRRS